MSDSERSAEAERPTSASETVEIPLLRVLRGNPTDEELAALVAVVSSLAKAAEPAGVVRRSEWSDHARRVRGAHRPGPDAWRRSALPS